MITLNAPGSVSIDFNVGMNFDLIDVKNPILEVSGVGQPPFSAGVTTEHMVDVQLGATGVYASGDFRIETTVETSGGSYVVTRTVTAYGSEFEELRFTAPGGEWGAHIDLPGGYDGLALLGTYFSELYDADRVIKSGPGDDILTLRNIGEVVWAGNGDDTIYGRGGADQLNGRGGDDVLQGDSGGDTLNGGAGDDVLTGGRIADVLTGGSGSDLFVYLDIRDSRTWESHDVITDFRPGKDRIDLSAIDANVDRRGNQSFEFVTDAPNLDEIGTIYAHVRGGATLVFVDNRSIAGQMIIEIAGTPTLSASDFVL